MLAVAQEHGFALWLAFGKIMRGWSLAIQDPASDGIATLMSGITACQEAGCGVVMPFWLAILGEAFGHCGQPEEGLRWLAKAEDMVRDTQERSPEAEVHRLRGQLLLDLQASAAAEDSFRQALGVARVQTARFWELRAATSLARLWRSQGKRSEALGLLAPVYGWFTEGFDTTALKGAKALLDELEPRAAAAR